MGIKKGPISNSDLIAIIDALSTPIAVAHSGNTYTLDVQNQFIKVFDIESADANAKTIALSNAPNTANKLVQIIIRIKCTTAAAFTHPAGVTFATAPSAFVTGQSYWVSYDSFDGGVSYAGIVVRRK